MANHRLRSVFAALALTTCLAPLPALAQTATTENTAGEHASAEAGNEALMLHVRSVADRVDAQRIMGAIEALPAQRSGWGSAEHWAGLKQTERDIEAALSDLGYDVQSHDIPWRPMVGRLRPEDRDAQPPTMRNLWVRIQGNDAQLAHEVLVLGAHFDAVPRSPGADDNGSGTAALLEIARALRDVRLKRTLYLVFFNLEEVGLVGSTHWCQELAADWQSSSFPREGEYAEHAQPRTTTLIGMVSLEMLGYYSSEPGSQRSPIDPIPGVFDPPSVGDFLAITTTAPHRAFSRALRDAMHKAEPRTKTLAADFFPLPPPDIMRSDHAPFLSRGFPAVMLTDTANFRNPHYHQPTDTVNTLDPDRLAHAARALAGAVVILCEPADEPAPAAGP